MAAPLAEPSFPGMGSDGGEYVEPETAPTAAALSVTRLGQITGVEDWKWLACGIDTLDLGLEVAWGALWELLVDQLEAGKARAAGTSGWPSADGEFLILPSGKPPNYRWHLQWPGFHLYIGRSQTPQRHTPNVYVSLNAQTLWAMPVREAVRLVEAEIQSLGGTVLRIKPSRCDFAADFAIPGGISLAFLLEHRVPRHVKHSQNMTGDALETFYHGAAASPIRLRIYNKSLEISVGGTKNWFHEIWQTEPDDEVWRVEFQVRRAFLKQVGVNSLTELEDLAGGIWEYLTHEAFSLRIPDDSNVTRRSVVPWWEAVQACGTEFGPALRLERTLNHEIASAEWYVSHCAGCLAGFGARQRLANFESAAEALVAGMRSYWQERDYGRQYTVKSIQLGFEASAPSPSVEAVQEERKVCE